MVKHRKSLFFDSMAFAMGGGTLAVSRRYRRWLQQQQSRLAAGSRLLDTSKGVLEYQMVGSGPVVLVLHGSPGGYDGGLSFAQVIGLDNCTLLSVSRPGYLRTPLSSGPSPEAQADLYAAALDALAVPQVAVVAVSGGGPSALQFALRHAARCRAVALFSALSQHYAEEEALATLPWFKRQFTRLGNAFIFWNPAVYVLDALSSMGPPENPARHIIQSMAMGQSRRDGNANDMHQFAQLPAFPGQEITVPTLIMHGTADTSVPWAQAEQLSRTIPHAEFHSIEGGRSRFHDVAQIQGRNSNHPPYLPRVY